MLLKTVLESMKCVKNPQHLRGLVGYLVKLISHEDPQLRKHLQEVMERVALWIDESN